MMSLGTGRGEVWVQQKHWAHGRFWCLCHPRARPEMLSCRGVAEAGSSEHGQMTLIRVPGGLDRQGELAGVHRAGASQGKNDNPETSTVTSPLYPHDLPTAPP